MADSKKYNGSTWEHSLRKLTTSTDTFTTLPVDVYADGNNATVGLQGNMSQTGTPTPDNPIMPQGTGDLETVGAKAGQYKIPISSAGQTTSVYLGEVETTRKVKKLVLTGEEEWYETGTSGRSFRIDVSDVQQSSSQIVVCDACCTHYAATTFSNVYNANSTGIGIPSNAKWIAFCDLSISGYTNFKAYLQQQYAAGTPVTIWYVLAEPETAVVNEPLMKIGDYADTVSSITVPMITGRDTFDVDTTLKPSEASLNYTGWHDATVKEWDGSQWNE